MAGWLPDNFEVPEQTVEKAIGSVRHRIMVRRKIARAARISGGFSAICAFALLLGLRFLGPERVSAPSGQLALSEVNGSPEVFAVRPEESSAPSVEKFETASSSSEQPAAKSLKSHHIHATKTKVKDALPVSVVKLDHSVAIEWNGDNSEEYEVYRCSTPKFETCSLVDEVRGTSWVDRGLDTLSNASTIVYYQVVPRTGV